MAGRKLGGRIKGVRRRGARGKDSDAECGGGSQRNRRGLERRGVRPPASAAANGHPLLDSRMNRDLKQGCGDRGVCAFCDVKVWLNQMQSSEKWILIGAAI